MASHAYRLHVAGDSPPKVRMYFTRTSAERKAVGLRAKGYEVEVERSHRITWGDEVPSRLAGEIIETMRWLRGKRTQPHTPLLDRRRRSRK